jgi:hypothetical protein
VSIRILARALLLFLPAACAEPPAADAPTSQGAGRAPPAADTVTPDRRGGILEPAADSGPVLADSGWTTGVVEVRNGRQGVATLRAVRANTHAGYDRLVFEFEAGPLPAYRVRYVELPHHDCGSGDEVRTAGGAALAVMLEPARAHDDTGAATVGWRARTTGFPALLELRQTCAFEAQVEWLAGLQTRTPYRVSTLPNPPRLVLDIRH